MIYEREIRMSDRQRFVQQDGRIVNDPEQEVGFKVGIVEPWGQENAD